jgi:hypothetical protein
MSDDAFATLTEAAKARVPDISAASIEAGAAAVMTHVSRGHAADRANLGTLDKLALFVRTGWRPAAGWVSAGILAVNGMLIPLWRLKDPSIPAVDWRQMTPFLVVLLGHAALRSWEKIKGADQ